MATITNTEHLTHEHIYLGSSHDDNAKRTLWVVALTAVMMVVEIIVGYITGSMALLADGFHMSTHAAALSVSAVAYWYAKRHAANRDYSFGTGKVGDLAGFASAMVLGMIAIWIGVESSIRIFQPIHVAFVEATWIATLGLAVNVASAFLLSGGNHHGPKHGHDHQHHHDHDQSTGKARDNNMRSAYIHVIADAFTSVLAIIALLSGRFLGWVWLDPIMGIVGAIVIARWSYSLMRDTAAVLLDRTDHHVADEVRELVETPGDAKLVDLHVWRIGPESHAGIVSVTGSPSIDRAEIQKRLKPVHELAHVTIEIR